jgi:hypothetical protein
MSGVAETEAFGSESGVFEAISWSALPARHFVIHCVWIATLDAS